MERIVRGRSATLTHTFYSSVTATDPSPDTATVTITRADGTAVVTAQAATEAGTGKVTYTVTPAQTALLDRWTVDWFATFGGQVQTFRTTVEVAGDVLFNVSDLNAEVANSTTTYTDAQMTAARTYAETQLENECGQAFVPRYELETFSGGGTTTTVLKWPRVTAVRSVTIDGTAVTPTSSVVALREGVAYYSSGWTFGYGNVVIGYEHGQTVLDPGASEAALVLAKHKLVKGPIDERATQRTSEFGPVNLATPGMFGARFGIPVVDAFCSNNDMSVGVA